MAGTLIMIQSISHTSFLNLLWASVAGGHTDFKHYTATQLSFMFIINTVITSFHCNRITFSVLSCFQTWVWFTVYKDCQVKHGVMKYVKFWNCHKVCLQLSFTFQLVITNTGHKTCIVNSVYNGAGELFTKGETGTTSSQCGTCQVSFYFWAFDASAHRSKTCPLALTVTCKATTVPANI